MNNRPISAGCSSTDVPALSESRGKLVTLELKVPEELYRAYQRCTWILINETDRSQLNIMEEVVEDFLIKHGC